jgi:hypothetical protein
VDVKDSTMKIYNTRYMNPTGKKFRLCKNRVIVVSRQKCFFLKFTSVLKKKFVAPEWDFSSQSWLRKSNLIFTVQYKEKKTSLIELIALRSRRCCHNQPQAAILNCDNVLSMTNLGTIFRIFFPEKNPRKIPRKFNP